MTLEELFRHMSFGALSALSIGNEGAGSISAHHHRKVALMVQETLVHLYARFNMLEREAVIRIYEDRTEYPFEKKYATMDPTVGPKFIEDNAGNIFSEDVMKVLQVFTSEGEEKVLNDPGVEESIFTPNSRLLLVPTPVAGDVLHVLYQAYHPKLSVEPGVDLNQIISVPAVLAPAIAHHVAYQILSGMNGPETNAKAADHLLRYETICNEADFRDLLTTSLVQTHTKLEGRGFP